MEILSKMEDFLLIFQVMSGEEGKWFRAVRSDLVPNNDGLWAPEEFYEWNSCVYFHSRIREAHKKHQLEVAPLVKSLPNCLKSGNLFPVALINNNEYRSFPWETSREGFCLHWFESQYLVVGTINEQIGANPKPANPQHPPPNHNSWQSKFITTSSNSV